MKMKKTDIGVIGLMYAICAYFYIETLKLKADSQTYPKFTIILLFGLTTLYLVQMLINAKKNGVTSGVEEVFKGFKAKQFFVLLAAIAAYVALIYVLGFIAATVIFMLAVLLYLRVPALHTVIAVAALTLLIYLAFVVFLGVRLPASKLF